ncbi:MAG: insulinase family protein [Deltaproteobacteria bacterium]|nr:insulinase family protein [Deltaproteobacteria bacterium]
MSARYLRSAAALATLALVLACNTSGAGKGSGQRRVTPDEPWRQARPPSGPVPELQLPAVQRADLKNGLTVLVIEDHSLPLVSARVVVRAGAAQESAKDAGLAALTWDLIDEGAGAMNQLALANALAQIGAELRTGGDLECGAAELEVAREQAEAGLKLLAAVVTKPTFGAADFERVRDQALLRAKERQGDARVVSDTLTNALVFGSEHPYGHDAAGTADTIGKLSALKVRAFWSTYAAPRNAALILAGDVTLEQAKALAFKAFGGWAGSGRAPKAPAEPTPRNALTLATVDYPGATQTAVRIGRAGLAASDADLPALLVLNAVLGGTRSSRLNVKLREEKQWTADARSEQATALGRGPWLVKAEVQSDAAADAVAEALAQIEAIKTGITDDELLRAKEGWARALPGRLGAPADQARALGDAFAQGFDADMVVKVAEAVRAVTADDIKRVAERVLVKEDLVVVLAGDRAALTAKLKEKGLPDPLQFGRDGYPE